MLPNTEQLKKNELLEDTKQQWPGLKKITKKNPVVKDMKTLNSGEVVNLAEEEVLFLWEDKEPTQDLLHSSRASKSSNKPGAALFVETLEPPEIWNLGMRMLKMSQWQNCKQPAPRNTPEPPWPQFVQKQKAHELNQPNLQRVHINKISGTPKTKFLGLMLEPWTKYLQKWARCYSKWGCWRNQSQSEDLTQGV